MACAGPLEVLSQSPTKLVAGQCAVEASEASFSKLRCHSFSGRVGSLRFGSYFETGRLQLLLSGSEGAASSFRVKRLGVAI